MSKFVTTLHIDLTQITKNLPKGALVEKVRLDAKNNVEVLWDCDALVTPYQFHVEFPLKNLVEKELPGGVKQKAQIDAERKLAAEAAKQQPAEEPKHEVINKLVKNQGILCVKCGKQIHWNGLDSYVHSDGKKSNHKAQKSELLSIDPVKQTHEGAAA